MTSNALAPSQCVLSVDEGIALGSPLRKDSALEDEIAIHTSAFGAFKSGRYLGGFA